MLLPGDVDREAERAGGRLRVGQALAGQIGHEGQHDRRIRGPRVRGRRRRSRSGRRCGAVVAVAGGAVADGGMVGWRGVGGMNEGPTPRSGVAVAAPPRPGRPLSASTAPPSSSSRATRPSIQVRQDDELARRPGSSGARRGPAAPARRPPGRGGAMVPGGRRAGRARRHGHGRRLLRAKRGIVAQRLLHLRGRAEARGRVLGQRAQDDRFQLRRDQPGSTGAAAAAAR